MRYAIVIEQAGDAHTTQPWRDGDAARWRLFRVTSGCGLHFDVADSVAA